MEASIKIFSVPISLLIPPTPLFIPLFNKPLVAGLDELTIVPYYFPQKINMIISFFHNWKEL